MIGVSLGAIVGGWAWGSYGWVGVCMVGVIAGFLALLRSFLPPITPPVFKEFNK